MVAKKSYVNPVYLDHFLNNETANSIQFNMHTYTNIVPFILATLRLLSATHYNTR